MTKAENTSLPLSPLAALQRLFARFHDQGMIIGGIAVSMLGRPRFTADVDAVMLVSTEELPELMETAAHEGFVPRISDAVTCWGLASRQTSAAALIACQESHQVLS